MNKQKNNNLNCDWISEKNAKKTLEKQEPLMKILVFKSPNFFSKNFPLSLLFKHGMALSGG